MALEVRITPLFVRLSLIRIEKSPLTIKKKQIKVNTSSLSHRNFQRRKDKTVNEGTMKQKPKNNKKQHKHECSINNSASLTPVQGPSSITCMIVTSPFVRLARVAGGLEQKMKRKKRVTKEDKENRQRCRMGEATDAVGYIERTTSSLTKYSVSLSKKRFHNSSLLNKLPVVSEQEFVDVSVAKLLYIGSTKEYWEVQINAVYISCAEQQSLVLRGAGLQPIAGLQRMHQEFFSKC
jgi:hypothetical protein